MQWDAMTKSLQARRSRLSRTDPTSSPLTIGPATSPAAPASRVTLRRYEDFSPGFRRGVWYFYFYFGLRVHLLNALKTTARSQSRADFSVLRTSFCLQAVAQLLAAEALFALRVKPGTADAAGLWAMLETARKNNGIVQVTVTVL